MDRRLTKIETIALNLRTGMNLFLLACLTVLGTVQVGRAAEEIAVPERRAFEAARIALDDGLYDYSEKRLSEFLAQHPGSPLVPQVKLFLAQSLYHQQKYGPSLTVLNENLPLATDFADKYQFWIGETLYADGDLDAAAKAYAELISTYPNSPLILSAAFKQAYISYQRKDYANAVTLLSSPDAAFESARGETPVASPAILGLLTLADSQFALGDFEGAEKTLARLPETGLPLEPAWQRVNLRGKIFRATNRYQETLELIPALLEAANSLMNPNAIAESHALHGEVLELLKRPAEAIEAYKPNLDSAVSNSWRRQALVKTVELSLLAGSAENAIAQLELLSAGQLDEPARDLVQLTLGELQLEQFYALPFDQRESGTVYSPAASNFLSSAQTHFNSVINGFTNSAFLGKAWMNRAWSDWQLQRWEAAANSFSNAVQRLPTGLDRAVAIFKLGDSQFRLNQYTNALASYDRLLTEYGDNEVIKGQLLDQVYYQIIQTGIAANDLKSAVPAMQALMGQFPGSFYADRSLLLVGQALNDVSDPAGARKVFEGFSERFVGSSLEPEVQLAIARTYELEGNWPAAVEVYGRWLTNHTTHGSIPTAVFGRAWGHSQAGLITNALSGFTNFVSSFPAHELTPVALQWLGDQFYTAKDYPAAELYYQRLFTGTNWPPSSATYQARVLASRAALGRQDYSEAKRYLTNLINMAKCPNDVRAEALFAYGDVLMSEPSENPSKFVDARGAFDRLISTYTNSVDVPAALGRIGDCNFQLKLYSDATNSYMRSMTHSMASVHERSQAEVKLGKALEKSAMENSENRNVLLDLAMEHYLNVFLHQNLNEEQQERPDPYWVQRAGLDAAALAESQKNHDQAARLYRRLKEMLPQMSDFLDQRIRQQEVLARRNGS